LGTKRYTSVEHGGLSLRERLYSAEYYAPEEITELIGTILNYYRCNKESHGRLSREVTAQLKIQLTPWEFAATIERNLTDDSVGAWYALYQTLYYVDKEDVPLGINSWRVLQNIAFNWRAKIGK